MSCIQTAVYDGIEIHEGATWCFKFRIKPDAVTAWDYSADVSLIRAGFRLAYGDVSPLFAIDSSVAVVGGSYIDTSMASTGGWIILNLSAAVTDNVSYDRVVDLVYDVEMVVPVGTTWSAHSTTLLGVTGTVAEEIVLKPLRGKAQFIPSTTF